MGKPPGHSETKPGKFWFSVPSPYSAQDPKLGRGCTLSPQFMSMSEGS